MHWQYSEEFRELVDRFHKLGEDSKFTQTSENSGHFDLYSNNYGINFASVYKRETCTETKYYLFWSVVDPRYGMFHIATKQHPSLNELKGQLDDFLAFIQKLIQNLQTRTYVEGENVFTRMESRDDYFW